MPDPLENPDVRSQLAKAGIVHRPGLADETLRELAPLLAADGIDVDDLGDIDLDAFNAALARATERHNLDLFTPVGDRRSQALAVLRRVAIAIAEDDPDSAQATLEAVDPDPGEGTPSVAQVIGAALGLLDAWHRDPALRSASERTRVPAWGRRSSAAARDILAIARKGRAFDTLDRLIVNYGGLAVLEGSALATAATLISRAQVQGTSVGEIADQVLGTDVPETPPAPMRRTRTAAGAASSAPPPPDAVLARQFRSWLGQQPYIPANARGQMAEDLIALRGTLRRHGLDLYRADEVPAAVEQLLSRGPEDLEDLEALYDDLITLDMYIHHRLEDTTGDEATAWDGVHDMIEQAVTEVEGALGELDDTEEDGPLAESIREAERIPPQERRETLARTRLVSSVESLLEWLGTGRACSPSGGVRRADIEQVAAMLGISAVGVSKRPPLPPSDQESLFAPADLDEPLPSPATIHALSMADVPVLAAWWRALTGIGLLDRARTRIRPGPAATPWTAQATPPLDLSEELVAAFLIHFLLQDLDRPGALTWVDEALTAAVAARLVAAATPELTGPRPTNELDQMLLPRTLRRMHDLAELGLLTVEAEQEFQVPPALRPAVLRGVATVITAAEDAAQEDDF